MKKHSRREFLRMSALTTAGLIAAGCRPKEEPTQAAAPTATPKKEEPTATPVPAKEVTLEIRISNPEYEGGEKQIWSIFQAENPNITLEFFSLTEGASADAHDAKIAGGWIPAMDWHRRCDRTNYQEFVNLLDIDFPWYDRYQYDLRTAWSERFGIPDVVPRCNPAAGFVFTWQYHADLMEEAGLDPQNDVKTWDDMKEWLAAGTEWANSQDDIAGFWDQAWQPWVFSNYLDAMTMAFPDGQREHQRKAWQGEIPINGPDSPYRHWFEFIVESYSEGWLTENFWAREWEPDMEANYIGKRSVMMMHGPWVWDKALAADPTVQQAGLPLTPPAEGQDPWMQFMGPVGVDSGAFMWAGAKELDGWTEAVKAFNWWHSPQTVKLTAELRGAPVLYDTDEPVELAGPQWLGVIKEIGQPGGKFEDVQFELTEAGINTIAKHQKDDAIAWTQWEWASQVYAPLAKGEIAVQDALDWMQKQIDTNYDIPT